MDGTVAAKGIAKANHNIFLDAERGRSTWSTNAAEEEDFYNGKHYTKRELVDMRMAGMMPIAVDRISPIINAEVAIFTSSRPTFKALPRDDGDVELAAMWSDILTYIWQSNDGDSQFQQCIQDYFVKGAGYIVVSVDPYADDGDGSILMRHAPVWDVYPDPNSREIDLSDARYIIVSRIVNKSILEFSYPDQMRKIKRASTTVGPKMDREPQNATPGQGEGGYAIGQQDYLHIDSVNVDDEVRVIERYEKIRVKHWKVIDSNTGEVNVYPADRYDPKQQASPGQIYQKIWRTRIRITATIGENVVLYRAILPTDTYPVVPFYLHHNGTPYPRSDVSVLKGMQREVNKRRTIMIHNASMQSNWKVLAQRGALHDKNKWETTGSQAGSVLEWNQGFEEPKQWHPGQLPQAWFTLEQEGKQDMEYAVSVFSNMMGSPMDSQETYRGMLALEEAGMRKIKHKVQHANHSLRRLGRVLMHYAQALYTMPKVMRIAGETNEDYKEIYLNQIGQDPITGRMKKFNDIGIGQYDIVVYDGTSMPTNRMALLNLYMELYQMGIIDKAEVLKKTDIPNRKAVMERMGEVQQLGAQVNSLGEQIKDIDGLNTTLRRQNQQLQIKIASMEGSMAIKDEVRQTQSQQRLMQARMADRLQILDKEAKLAVREVRVSGAEAGISLKHAELLAKKKSLQPSG